MNISSSLVVLAPVVIGVIQVIKLTRVIADRFIPLTALIIGVLGAFLLAGWTVDSILPGIAVGLSAMGLWSGTKATLENM